MPAIFTGGVQIPRSFQLLAGSSVTSKFHEFYIAYSLQNNSFICILAAVITLLITELRIQMLKFLMLHKLPVK